MSDRVLDVWCFGEIAGRLIDHGGSLQFEYGSAWIDAGRPRLSQSLPLSGEFDSSAVASYFGGLLPEGELRRLLGRRLGVSYENDFSLLDQLGEDCAGAISLYRPGRHPALRTQGVRWLSDGELGRLVKELPSRPMHAEPDGELRLSLAGAQDKLPVVVEGGRIGLPLGGRPSTHIMKTPIAKLPATVLNEALWSRVGGRLGIACAASVPHRIGDAEMLLVERYDRAVVDGAVVRLHQEDFCQALSIPSPNKYQREGGPGLVECFRLLRAAASRPAADVLGLLNAWALSFIAANHDAHAKNFSLLYTSSATTLAPAYDVLNTAAYWKIAEMDRKMAMSVGGEYRPGYVKRRHIESMLNDCQLGVAASLRRLRTLASDAPGAIRDARRDLTDTYWDHPQLDRIVELSLQRSRILADITS